MLSLLIGAVTMASKWPCLRSEVAAFKEIVEGKHDDLPEQAFYMVGSIEEAVEAGVKMGETGS